MELSGATTANWVAKTANLLVDGLGGPSSVGLWLPLHWQAVALLLAAAATSAEVVLAKRPEELAGCGAAFVLAEHAEGALEAGVEDVVGLSGHPLGLPAPGLPALVVDYATEVPSYADHYGGPRPGPARVRTALAPVTPLTSIEPGARVLTTLAPADPDGAAVILGTLAAGGGLVLLRGGEAASVGGAEHVTATAGFSLPGLTRLA